MVTLPDEPLPKASSPAGAPSAKDESIVREAIPPVPVSDVGLSKEPPSEPIPIREYPLDDSVNVYFEQGSTRLTEKAIATIAENATRLKTERGLSVMLVGYADDYGSASFGIALAHQRVKVVEAKLSNLDVPRRKISVKSYNKEPPFLSPCTSEDCRRSYRRVEFRFDKASVNESATPASAKRPSKRARRHQRKKRR